MDFIIWMYKCYITDVSSIFNDGLNFILMLLSSWPGMFWVWVCVESCDVFCYIG